MFEERGLMFLYALSPVHMGAGQAIGVVDNPIQRERHTNHPIFAGSGIKGSLRDLFEMKKSKVLTVRVFGPEASASDHAGAVSFGDAQVVLFPVRSLRESYAYVTCPTALGRLKRAAEVCRVSLDWVVPQVEGDDHCLVGSGERKLLVAGGEQARLVLETFEFKAKPNDEVAKIATWLADKALPEDGAYAYFREKVKRDLVVLTDTRFKYYVENATSVEPHVRIADESGTADEGGLFYTENVPPEALFVSVVLVSQERVKKGEGKGEEKNNKEKPMRSKEILEHLREALHHQVVQIGGDATNGRGLVTVSLIFGNKGGA